MTSAKAFRLGLIGHPVSHSKSPEIFREKFDREGFSNASYELFDLTDLDNFEAWIIQQANADIPLLGFNVTVPHKTQIIQFLTTISAEVQAIQAVNTVVVSRDPITQAIQLHGHNTDVDGFAKSLEIVNEMRIENQIHRVLCKRFRLQQSPKPLSWEMEAVPRRYDIFLSTKTYPISHCKEVEFWKPTPRSTNSKSHPTL